MMNHFWTLVKFEYKKIMQRKTFLFAVCLLLFTSTFCMIGDVLLGMDTENGVVMSSYDFEQQERVIQHQVAGYVDSAMIADIVAKNVTARGAVGADGIYDPVLYETNIRPYHTLRSSLARVLSPVDAFDFANFNQLNSSDGVDFYQLRTKHLTDELLLAGSSEVELQKTLALNEELSTPFYQDYHNGYQMFLFMIGTSALFFVFAVVFCVSPIFSGEYGHKTDAIILATKFGKNKLIAAKLFTAMSFTLLMMTAALLLAVLTIFTVYSVTGAEVSFQMYRLNSILPFTMAQAVVLYCGVALAISVLVTAITLCFSAKLNSYATISAISLLLFLGLFIAAPSEKLELINYLLPAKLLNEGLIFRERLIGVLGIYLHSYQLIFVLCAVLVAVLLPFAYQGFKKHQVS